MKFICFLFGLFFYFDSYSQNIFFLDNKLEIIKEKDKAIAFLEIEKINDTCFQYNYYGLTDLQLIKVESYKNENGTILNGFFGYYNANGHLDSCGYLNNSKKNSYWIYFDASGENEDSIIKMIHYDNNIVVDLLDKPNIKNSVEASFKDGSFLKFLEKNLIYPKAALYNKKSGLVKIGFDIDINGVGSNFFIIKSCNFYLDKEAFRVVELSSHKWNPALNNNLPVKSKRIQPINFVIASE